VGGLARVTSLVGEAAPSFRLPDADGHPVALADVLGRPVLLVFTRHVH
jgi:peroxiredoxin